MEEHQEKNKKTLLRVFYFIMLCFCFYHLVKTGYYIISYPDYEGAKGTFSYPLTLPWLCLVFSFWFFFGVGCLLSIYLKKLGWILTNALLLYSLGYVVAEMFTHGIATDYLILSVVLLSLLIVLGQKALYRVFFTDGKIYAHYLSAIGIAIVWVIPFLLIDKH